MRECVPLLPKFTTRATVISLPDERLTWLTTCVCTVKCLAVLSYLCLAAPFPCNSMCAYLGKEERVRCCNMMCNP